MLHFDKVAEEIRRYSGKLELEKEIIQKELSMALRIFSELDSKFYTEINSLRDALNYLHGKSVCGIDGSQIEPSREMRVPVGGVQAIALTVNHGDGSWEKEVEFRIIEWDDDVSLERFKLECEVAKRVMDGKRWIFIDGSLILSFVSELRTSLREGYLDSITDLLRHSKSTRTPVLGIVDRSRARDVISSLSDISEYKFSHIHDSILFSETLDTGYFTEPSLCRREILELYGGIEIWFMYLNVNGEIIRVEFPEWMLNMTEEIAGIVHSECLVSKLGNYPYILERAHLHAVIREREKLEFYRMVGSYNPSSKSISKVI